MPMTPDTVSGIVASVLGASSATSYVPTDPGYGLIIVPDEFWINSDTLVKYVRIDGLTTRGYVTDVEIHTCGAGIITAPDSDSSHGTRHPAARIRDAINAVVSA